MILRAPTNKPIILSGVRPNAGLEAAYRKKIDLLLAEMHNSVLYWVTAAYRANTPEIAQDASPAMELRTTMRDLGTQWMKKIDAAAPALAAYFSQRMQDRADGALQDILLKHGFAVKWKMTREANDVMQACIGEQVGLIRSIAQQYLGNVERLVMQSVSTGRDLKTLTDALGPKVDLARIGMGQRAGESDKSLLFRTRRRAALIARDQNNKATASMTRARYMSLGITEAIWMHSHGGKTPRPEHQKWDKKRYNPAKGMWSEVDQEYVWPGTQINCRCNSRPVIPGL